MSIVRNSGDKVTSLLKFSNLKNYENIVQIETFINSINMNDWNGKEIILHLSTQINNKKTFYTDSNGLEL